MNKVTEPLSANAQSACGEATTAAASRYLQQLCKHWSHKAHADFNENAGRIVFKNGTTLAMSANADQLILNVQVAFGADLEQFKSVVVDHLKRFAFRETLEIHWDD